MTEKEKTLLAGCVKGEKAAWDAFVLQYSALVYHSIKKTFSLYHAEPQSERVDDLFQEFFVAILLDDCKKLRQFRGESGCSLASWIRLVAVRLTIDLLRRQSSPSAAVGDVSVGDSDLSAAIIHRQEEETLSHAIATLSSRDQLFVELCFHRELPPKDIAAILKMSVSAVYTQKSRVLAKLREIIEKPALL